MITNGTGEKEVENEKTRLLGGKTPQHDTELQRALSNFIPPSACCRRPVVYTMVLLAVTLLLVLNPTHRSERNYTVAQVAVNSSSNRCIESPCFEPLKNTVVSKPGFPSFFDVANRGRIDVSYDSRSIRINDERVLLLGGSVHPSRATKQTYGTCTPCSQH